MLKDDFRRNIQDFRLQEKTVEIGAFTKIKKDANKLYGFKSEPR